MKKYGSQTPLLDDPINLSLAGKVWNLEFAGADLFTLGAWTDKVFDAGFLAARTPRLPA